ncbi:hypothetical protein [Halothiobacillus sp.]|uniref:hypothetical protein n=1 Tax=Halothiobacillus sp. TaxID=1891311 RepID=UPI002AD281AA|nr:hypothetical protein [Halothiobacillus sp.]
MNDELDRLLARDLLDVPDDFERTVMARIHELPDPVARVPARQSPKATHWLAGLALAGGAAVGLLQLLGFVFGIWMATSAN